MVRVEPAASPSVDVFPVDSVSVGACAHPVAHPRLDVLGVVEVDRETADLVALAADALRADAAAPHRCEAKFGSHVLSALETGRLLELSVGLVPRITLDLAVELR